MVFKIEYPLIGFCTLSLIGIIAYWFLSITLPDHIPKEIIDVFFIISGFLSIPFLIWMGFTKSDEEWREEIKKDKEQEEKNKRIFEKYDRMPELRRSN